MEIWNDESAFEGTAGRQVEAAQLNIEVLRVGSVQRAEASFRSSRYPKVGQEIPMPDEIQCHETSSHSGSSRCVSRIYLINK